MFFLAIQANAVNYQALCKVKIGGEFVETTPGRVIFNDLLPDEVAYVNKRLGDKEIRALVADTHEEFGSAITVTMLDVIKDTGYKYATIFGATIGMDDILVPDEKKTLINDANSEVDQIQKQYHSQ